MVTIIGLLLPSYLACAQEGGGSKSSKDADTGTADTGTADTAEDTETGGEGDTGDDSGDETGTAPDRCEGWSTEVTIDRGPDRSTEQACGEPDLIFQVWAEDADGQIRDCYSDRDVVNIVAEVYNPCGNEITVTSRYDHLITYVGASYSGGGVSAGPGIMWVETVFIIPGGGAEETRGRVGKLWAEDESEEWYASAYAELTTKSYTERPFFVYEE